jgi:hypothetical protein
VWRAAPGGESAARHVLQLARYWSLVFLFSAISLAIFLGIRERSRGWLASGA